MRDGGEKRWVEEEEDEQRAEGGAKEGEQSEGGKLS